ncbi:MAG: RNA polymerase sigma factor [Nanoarchaeota archaeon]|nr:RNA polymerase sigma factor [Nanoarchaeota archaeon]MBU1051361.1 RNA polymerase sigma factor [Nanoarchaeota archaeon]MBU1988376.1 RNA polymerase sigma factor [Nanoarchaeota archaeon]
MEQSIKFCENPADFGLPERYRKDIVKGQKQAYVMIRRIVKHLHDVDEIFQQTLYNVLKRLSTFEGRSTFSTWLTTIARNAALNHQRDAQIRKFVAVDEAYALTDESQGYREPWRRMQTSEESELDRKIIELLSEDERIALELARAEIPYKESGLNTNTVKTRVRRTRQRLRRMNGKI